MKKIVALTVAMLILFGNLAYAGWLIPDDRNPSINTSINPNVNTSLNPKINKELNPAVNTSINPDVNTSLNPYLNANINPKLNPSINPKLNTDINPQINTSINPKINSAINPKIKTANVLFSFDKNLRPEMYIVTANPDFLLFYNQEDELAQFAVKHSATAYVLFDLTNRWAGYMIRDAVGFVIFSSIGEWIGIVR